MRKKLKVIFFMVLSSYALLALCSYLFSGKIDVSFIGMWGFLLGFLLLLAAFPFHKIVFFGGRGIMGVQAPEIPGDEHLHQKIQKSYENENKAEILKNRYRQDILSIAGISIILIALFLV